MNERDTLFPPDSGVIDVTQAPYCAKGDGIADDTAAIQRALSDHPSQGAIIFLPAGIYRITDTLCWPRTSDNTDCRFTTLQGQSRERTVIRLASATPGFTDRHNPRALIWTGSAPAQRFRNQVHDLTVDIEEGNPGAIGMQFMANNQGGVYDVTIRSRDGEACIGLDMSYSDEIGPLLVKNLRVEGCVVGVKLRYWVDGVTMEHVHLEGQKECGILNDGQCLTIRDLVSINGVTAVKNLYGASLLCLIDADLRGTGAAAGLPAVLNEAGLFARNVCASGYALTIDDREARRRVPTGERVEEYTSHEPHTLFPGEARSLRLPVRETPEVPWDAFDQWSSPTHFGYEPGSGLDASAAIQKAVDSGASTVYLPRGSYRIDATVLIRGKVRRLIGCDAHIDCPVDFGPAFKILDGSAPVVIMERMYSLPHQRTWIETNTSRTFVMRLAEDICMRNLGTGDIYLEDVVANPHTFWEFHGQHVWARQFNVEQVNAVHCLNDGGTLWILGFKVENDGVRVLTKSGGKTEILGGFMYSQGPRNAEPAFVCDESSLSLSAIGEACFNNRPVSTLVQQIQDGEDRRLTYGQARYRANGSMIVLFAAH